MISTISTAGLIEGSHIVAVKLLRQNVSAEISAQCRDLRSKFVRNQTKFSHYNAVSVFSIRKAK